MGSAALRIEPPPTVSCAIAFKQLNTTDGDAVHATAAAF
jgi:hypothetical protein